MFKVNYKDTRTTSGVVWKYVTPCSSVSIVNFEELNTGFAVITNFLKIHICNTSYVEINMLFAIFNNKGSGSFKVRSNHSTLKGMDAG